MLSEITVELWGRRIRVCMTSPNRCLCGQQVAWSLFLGSALKSLKKNPFLDILYFHAWGKIRLQELLTHNLMLFFLWMRNKAWAFEVIDPWPWHCNTYALPTALIFCRWKHRVSRNWLLFEELIVPALSEL